MRTRLLVSAGLAAALLLGGALAGTSQAGVTPAATGVTLTIGGPTGTSLPAGFVGFSFEANILAGTAPLQAVLVQAVVMFLVLAATATTTVVIALGLIRRLFTPDHRLVYLATAADH